MLNAISHLGTATGILAATAVGGAVYSTVIEMGAFTLRRAYARVLPEGAPSLRVLHLSDLHMHPRNVHRVRWVQGLISLKPDLVVNTGDNLSHRDGIDGVAQALGPLFDVPGVFVFGSNDYYEPVMKNPLRYLRGPSVLDERPLLPVEDLRGVLLNAGWIDLNNSRELLSIRGVPLDFVGVDDPHINRDDYESVRPPTGGAPRGVTRVAVVHAPYLRVVDAMTVDKSDIILAGHTHGGQVCVPGIGALATNCDLPRRYAKGLHQWAASDGERSGRSWLHVSAGLGTSSYTPFRFACPPEATLLTLLPQ